MAEHTPTPWTLAPKPHASWIGSIGNNPGDPQLWSVATPFPKGDKRADAELIVRAVNNHAALLAFFQWAMREGPWDGGDLDGASIQDKAESLGLIVKTQYDAEKHGVQSDFEHGDDWFEYAPQLRADVGGPVKP